MHIAKKLMIAAAIPAFAFAAAAQAPAAKEAPKTAAANKTVQPAAKPAPKKTLAETLSFLPEVLAEGKGMKIMDQKKRGTGTFFGIFYFSKTPFKIVGILFFQNIF